MKHWVIIAIYLLGFLVSFYALSGLDFAKLLRKGSTGKAQVLLLLMSLALGYLVAQFCLVLVNFA